MGKRILMRNVLLSLFLLLLTIVIDFLEFKFKVISLQTGRLIYNFIYPISFLMYLFVNKSSCDNIENKFLRWFAIVGVSLLITVICWLIIIAIGVNIRIRLGGGI